jgi:hypothetical protein
MTTANPQKMYADAKLHLEVTGDDGVLLDRTYTTTILTTAGLHASLSAVAKTVTDDAAAERRDRWQVRPSGPTTVHARLELSFTRTNTSDNELFSVHEASMTTGGGSTADRAIRRRAAGPSTRRLHPIGFPPWLGGVAERQAPKLFSDTSSPAPPSLTNSSKPLDAPPVDHLPSDSTTHNPGDPSCCARRTSPPSVSRWPVRSCPRCGAGPPTRSAKAATGVGGEASAAHAPAPPSQNWDRAAFLHFKTQNRIGVWRNWQRSGLQNRRLQVQILSLLPQRKGSPR